MNRRAVTALKRGDKFKIAGNLYVLAEKKSTRLGNIALYVSSGGKRLRMPLYFRPDASVEFVAG
jgi:hypothetical protein